MTLASAQWMSSPRSRDRYAQCPPCGVSTSSTLRIRQQLRPRLRQHPHKRIIHGAKNQRGNRNLVDHTRARRTIVVVIGIAKSAISRDDLVVKLPQRADRARRRPCRRYADTAQPCADIVASTRAKSATHTHGLPARAAHPSQQPDQSPGTLSPRRTVAVRLPHSPASFSTRLPPIE